MDRIPVYTDIENLIEVFSMERQTDVFSGLKHFLSKESILTFCADESVVCTHPFFQHLAKEFASGNFVFKYIDETESFLKAPFKTNLQERLTNKSSVLLSNDKTRVDMSIDKNGFLIGSIGQEVNIYNKLNLQKSFFRANRILTIGDEFKNYNDLEQFILPFTEIIINEPYLFLPERREFDLSSYLDNNFKGLFDSVFKNVKNKVNVVISTYVNEQFEQESNWFELATRSFNPLFDFIRNYLTTKLGAANYKLWLVVSPMVRQARHDRYILTNYQYIESGAGLTFFDDRGNFINRGEAIHLYSILHDDFRRSTLPSVINNLQNKVVDSVKVTHPHRIYKTDDCDSHFLKFK
jgi:hypothetical protein